MLSKPSVSDPRASEFSISAAQRDWESQIIGWDTGPGNSLLDLAVADLSNGEKKFDKNGEWAAQGTPCEDLVAKWLQHPFFQQPPPKSTGRELFGDSFWQNCWADARSRGLTDADILATLTELTAASIACSYETFLPKMPDTVLLCGGGSHNRYLKQRLQRRLQLANSSGSSIQLLLTDEVGVNADFKEAIAFAVLACWRQQEIPGNLPSVTGAHNYALLGDLYGFSKSRS
jgi:anhydro-N-acetylmuramic acid kinase